jgi:DNA (cytosine-5)-methyltransferase 1
MEKNRMKLTVVDLFSGAGGLSRGFQEAGFEVVLGVDFDDSALLTFENNHGGAKALKLDLFDHSNITKICEELIKNNKTVDVLVGGPPCQGFSLAGKRDRFDERNVLYSSMVKTAALIKPRAVVLENVPGMLTLYDGKAKEKILKDFTELGYNMKVKILYAPDYGVPQIRKRVFFVGLLNSLISFEFPQIVNRPNNYVTCEEAINDLPTLEDDERMDLKLVRDYACEPISEYQKQMRINSKSIYNHTPTKHTQKTIDLISMVPEGGNYKDLPSEMIKNFKYHESLTRYHSKKPSRTIDTGHRTHFHYKYNRIPSVRENARLQSFSDDFIFYGNKQEQYKQVGNAVPPLLGKAIAIKLKEYLKDDTK